MGILENAIPTVIVCTRDRARATAFYRDVLGLKLDSEDSFAAIFRVGEVTLRVSTVADFVAHEHTILGFRVTDVRAAVAALSEKGVVFKKISRLKQDELGIWTAPGGAVSVAWLTDMDGNVLSVSNV